MGCGSSTPVAVSGPSTVITAEKKSKSPKASPKHKPSKPDADAAPNSKNLVAVQGRNGPSSSDSDRVKAPKDGATVQYGSRVFTGAVADKYLKMQGEKGDILKDPSWVKTKADKVAAALMQWGKDNNATVYTHWFQPLGANGVRPGMTGQVHNHMFTFGKDGKPNFQFDGETLCKGETDGSSYPNGGLRVTHTAGAYTIIDPNSPIFMKDDTIFIPTSFVSWNGYSLDEKMPLLRAETAMSMQAVRLLKLMGYNTKGVIQNIGLEQEFFFVPLDAYARRPDLQLSGRTIQGRYSPKGQEMCDHYMSSINPVALACIREIQDACFQLGIPLKTRHREVAPGQYEMAPYFGHAPQQIDQNIMAMQLLDEISKKHGLAVLFQEKPFAGINGSGKHNNWSLGTKDGVNLLNAKQITEKSGNPDVFPTLIAAIVQAVHRHADLMRAAVAAPGNDFRLGAMEAPPAIISTYLGETLTNFLDAWRKGERAEYKPKKLVVQTGCDSIDPFQVPTEDRNRTSPFPYGGHRFEFRAVGSAQNVSIVNTFLATMCAESFKEFADAMEKGTSAHDVASKALNEHWNVIFNGDGYSEEWPVEAEKRGLLNVASGIEALANIGSDKNIALFEKMSVMSKDELLARRDTSYQHYSGMVEIEAKCMIDMVQQQILPALKRAEVDTADIEAALPALKEGLHEFEHESDDYAKATLGRVLRLETMEAVRAACDEAEGLCPADMWPLATYRELLHLDVNQDALGNTTALGNGQLITGERGIVGKRGIVGEAASIDPATFGTHVFTGAVADKYLKQQGEKGDILKDPSWTKTKANKVAAAIQAWGRDNGATVTTHWFQPMGANGVRPGMTGQVHNHMFTFGKDGKPEWSCFDGETLLQGESDGSSYPNGGLRVTHTAGAYTVLDPNSPIFMRDDTIFIPTAFISWNGFSIDEKTPMMRAETVMSKQAVRLLKLMGYKTDRVQQNIGLEQEFFFVPRTAYARRPDLQLSGRTIMGKHSPKGQEMCDHYMSSINPVALACIREIQDACFQLGIPLKTRHREVAPGQYEMAPYFGHAPQQIDQNIMAMQLLDEISAKHGLAVLFQEKPFAGINGSGKHNNWSLGTKDGVNLLNAKQITKESGNPDVFPVLISAIVKALDKHGDLMRATVACPGNDFRLGAMEAPPAIISTYLGETLTEFLDTWRQGQKAEYKPKKLTVETGCDDIDAFQVPTEDRNRTSPFPYGGHRFEFRAVGSAQNVSMVNTVLATICAETFQEFADAIEGGESAHDVAAKALNDHWRIIFNGNGYGEEWPVEAAERGLLNVASNVEAMDKFGDKKNLDLFAKMGVMSNEELMARKTTALQHYSGMVEIEAKCMIDMVNQMVLPSCKRGGVDTADIEAALPALKEGLQEFEHESDDLKKATLGRVLRLETMEAVRAACDEAEALCPADVWMMATYRELLHLDVNQDYYGNTVALGNGKLIPSVKDRTQPDAWDPSGFGSKVFTGAVADKWLATVGEKGDILKDSKWTKTKADKVAQALMAWGRANGACVTTHWFQPMGANGVRPGMTGQVHNHMFTFGKDGKPKFAFDGETLLQGETDGSSYPNGGLRVTHTAGAYTILDPTSPIFMRDDTIFIPTAFVSWNGYALDEKTPMLRAESRMSKECCRLLKLMGFDAKGVIQNIGLEQEFFFVPLDAYARRPDLQLSGRTIQGRYSPKGQEMCDHYFAAPNTNALACLREIQDACFQLGIPLKTRHREVAPGQYEMAPYFGHAPQQIDQNIMAMQLLDEISKKHGLAVLFQEKPFAGINGSGKHNNWSLGTTAGLNLLNAGQVTKATKSKDVFPVLIAAIVQAVNRHADLMRATVACPGNDFRLGAMEAPPAIFSTYLGESLTQFLEEYKKGDIKEYKPNKPVVQTGCDSLAPFTSSSEDRNRTSPFPYGGHRFEFRAVGSAQNVSIVNTVLATICAESFKEFADAIEKGQKPHDVATKALNNNWKIIFNGDGYGDAWPEEAEKRGLLNVASNVEAMDKFGDKKNLDLFAKMGVMSNEELMARKTTSLQHYSGMVEIEAKCMIDMVQQSILPALRRADMSTDAIEAALPALKEGLQEFEHESDDLKKATLGRVLRLETMEAVRAACDEAEETCPADLWPFATYRELLHLDANQDYYGNTVALANGKLL